MILILAPSAQIDIDDIWEYTAAHWDVTQAEAYVRQITDKCAELATGTRSGRSVATIRPGYFKYPVGSHIVYYRFANDDVLEIVRILHQRMDPGRHLE